MVGQIPRTAAGMGMLSHPASEFLSLPVNAQKKLAIRCSAICEYRPCLLFTPRRYVTRHPTIVSRKAANQGTW